MKNVGTLWVTSQFCSIFPRLHQFPRWRFCIRRPQSHSDQQWSRPKENIYLGTPPERLLGRAHVASGESQILPPPYSTYLPLLQLLLHRAASLQLSLGECSLALRCLSSLSVCMQGDPWWKVTVASICSLAICCSQHPHWSGKPVLLLPCVVDSFVEAHFFIWCLLNSKFVDTLLFMLWLPVF